MLRYLLEEKKMAISFELYEALKSVGVHEEKARTTAEKFEEALENKFEKELERLVTKEDLAKMETQIIKWNVGTIIAVVSITVAIVKLIS